MKRKILTNIALLLILGVLSIGTVFATIDPDHLEATLNPGECITETKTVFLPGVLPCADIIFAFDTTASMVEELSVAGTEAIDIMNTITPALISDARFGVISFRDYPNSYSSCGYSSEYGDAVRGDYPYSLDWPLTTDMSFISGAIGGLIANGGSDLPESYTRAMYESYSDPAIVWRDGCKRILIIFGDAVPHDCNLNEGCTTGTYSTGVDPGRDTIAGNADDLDLQTVLTEMITNDITLLFVGCGSSPDEFALWECWTAQTGGDAWLIGAADEIPAAIEALVGAEAAHIDSLTLETTCTDLDITVTPLEYTDIDIPPAGTTRTFDVEICVPAGTPPCTTINCEIWANGDDVNYGTQTVTINTPCDEEEHDVEAVSQTVTDSEVMPGDIVDIEVTVTNNGDYTETFDLTCYYDSVEIGTILVVDLAPGETRVVTFTWDTTGVPLNGYSITAWADSGEVIAEVDEVNNECTMPLKIFVIPELPLGTILASLSMFGALIGYVGFKRYRKK